MPNRLHRREQFGGKPRRCGARRAGCGALPGLDRVLAHGAPSSCSAPRSGERLSAQGNPAARDLVRHAFADVGGNGNRARSWAKFARRWPTEPQRQLLDAYPRIDAPGAPPVGRRGPRATRS